jgi:hypothetical protein
MGASENASINLAHDADRLANGNILITDGGSPGGAGSKVFEVDSEGNTVWSYADLNFAHNADRLDNGNTNERSRGLWQKLRGKLSTWSVLSHSRDLSLTLIADTGNNRVIEVDAEDNVVWNSDDITLSDGSSLSFPTDADLLANDNVLIADSGNHRVIEIDRTGNVVWQFGETGAPGDDDAHLSGPFNADCLDNGNILIADSGNNRIIEVDSGGNAVWEYRPVGPDALDWPRDADRLADGNVLITDSRNNRIIEVTPQGNVVWSYATGLSLPFDADRLQNGNNLIADSMNGRVIEVNAAGEVVWEYPVEAKGTIAGTVKDEGGQPITGAVVSVYGTTLSDTTDASGNYAITGVPVAAPRYILTASKSGYFDAQQGNIDVSAGVTVTVNLTMEAGTQVPETLEVKFCQLLDRDPSGEKLYPPPDAVLDPDLYPDEVKPYMEPGLYIESDDPDIQAVAASILAGIPEIHRTRQTTVAHEVYVWMVKNIEYDLMANYPGDVTCGNWQTVNGGWGHSFGEWCYTAKEVLEEGRAICIEHARLATALLRALDIPARPAPLIAHPVTQWWVQLPDGSGFWANMDTSVGRSRYVETGDLWANFPSVEEHVLGYWMPDADAPIHMEWWTDNPCIWREDGQGRSYEHTPEGLQLAWDGLTFFAQYGFLPTPVPPPGPGEPYYSLDVRGFVVDLTNAREQGSFDVSFPLPIESQYLELIDYVHWTNHPEWVVRTWVETKSDPETGESLSFYHVELDRRPGCKVYLPLVTKSYQAGFSYEVGECQETPAALTNDQVEI